MTMRLVWRKLPFLALHHTRLHATTESLVLAWNNSWRESGEEVGNMESIIIGKWFDPSIMKNPNALTVFACCQSENHNSQYFLLYT